MRKIALGLLVWTTGILILCITGLVIVPIVIIGLLLAVVLIGGKKNGKAKGDNVL